ncbi:hypothetical protein FQA39_LY12273 [Lamprigera yunnana]|nr:hypothetical protein FQA39_LY12273 [Lamprigera yunnana]
MTNKTKLRNYRERVYINDDMTKEERKVQADIWKLAKEESVKVEIIKMSLEMLQSEAVADIPTVDPNNDFYVMEPEKELLDCINTVDESQLEKLDNTILAINVPTSMDAEEDNNNIWKVVNVSQAQNMQDIEEEVTNNIMVNEEKGNGSNNESRNIHQHVASEEMIQGEEDYHDIEN